MGLWILQLDQPVLKRGVDWIVDHHHSEHLSDRQLPLQ
jgi:hypothetical protein